MNIGFRFLFISKFFVLLFIVINITYIFPISIFDVTYYLNFSTVILDTSTLLVLGLAIPKFAYLNNLQILRKSNNNSDSKLQEISLLENKIFYNSRISYILSIFFLILALIQPINLIFTLNKNDIYSSGMVQTLNNKLKIETNILEKEYNLIEQELTEEKKAFNIDEKKKTLNSLAQKNIQNFLKRNNKSIFNKIKFIIRNLIMAIIWALIFYKLSSA